MFGYEEINLSLAYSAFYLFIALILIGAYSYYVYRYTIPQIEKYKKFLLTSLRVLALLILCLILFEPILNLSSKLVLEPNNLVFVDNSRSIKIDDGTQREQKVKKILDEFSDNTSAGNLSFYQFGNSVDEISTDSLANINFSDGSTNLQEVFNNVKNSEKNIASVTIITDGVITSGSNPYYDALNLGIPVFTIGIGDTTRRKDIDLKKVLHNDFIYAQTPTSIIATISNNGFAGESVKATLMENNEKISERNLILSNAGIQNISFDYSPQSAGQKKLSIQLSSLKDEFTTANNKNIFYVNVLSNKIKVLLLASTPSSDLSFIKNSLTRDENIEVSSIVQISANKFLEELNYQKLDSAEVLFLIGFPSDQTPQELFNRVISKIKTNKTPYFVTLSSGISLNRLSQIGNDLPFRYSQNFPGFKEVQPFILPAEISNPIIQYSKEAPREIWNNLPPVLQRNGIFTPRVESKTISQISINNKVINTPLIVSKSFSGKRSIAVLAKDIWKWKLQVASKGLDVFDNFIINSVRWLRANEEQKLFELETSKRNYSQGERIEFFSKVLDESLNPVSDAEIKINITSGNTTIESDMQNVGPGLYESSIVINETGDFTYSAQATIDNRILGEDRGSFNIGEIDIEMIDPVMDYSSLNLISNETGGEFYFPGSYSPLIDKLKTLKINSSKDKIVSSEINLWSNSWMLIIAILLFAAEWFIRKRSGMM